MMSTCLLETCRGLKYTYYIKEMCVNLVTYRKLCLSLYTIELLMMNTCLLETCRGLKYTYYIKEMCVNLVTYRKLYRDIQGEQNTKQSIH